jgi:hypothetical protein
MFAPNLISGFARESSCRYRRELFAREMYSYSATYGLTISPKVKWHVVPQFCL